MCFSKLKKNKKRKKGGVTDIPIEMKITDVHNWGVKRKLHFPLTLDSLGS
jgi:hypothetical protein